MTTRSSLETALSAPFRAQVRPTELVADYVGDGSHDAVESAFYQLRRLALKLYNLSSDPSLFTGMEERWVFALDGTRNLEEKKRRLEEVTRRLDALSIRLGPATQFSLSAVVKGEEARGLQSIQVLPGAFPREGTFKSYVFYHGKLYALQFTKDALKRLFERRKPEISLPNPPSARFDVYDGSRRIVRWNLEQRDSVGISWDQQKRTVRIEEGSLLWVHEQFPAWETNAIAWHSDPSISLPSLTAPIPLPQVQIARLHWTKDGEVLTAVDVSWTLPEGSLQASATEFWRLFQAHLPLEFIHQRICPEWLVSAYPRFPASSAAPEEVLLTLSLSDGYLKAGGKGCFVLETLWRMYGGPIFRENEARVRAHVARGEPGNFLLPEIMTLAQEVLLQGGDHRVHRFEHVAESAPERYRIQEMDELSFPPSFLTFDLKQWEQVGRGGHGIVYLTERRARTGEEEEAESIVVKVCTPGSEHQLAREELRMHRVAQAEIPFATKLLDVVSPKTLSQHPHPLFEPHALVFPYHGVSLSFLTKHQPQRLHIGNLRRWTRQLFQLLQRLKAVESTHGDLTVNNILVHAKNDITVIDWAQFRSSPTSTEKYVAPLGVMPPEICFLQDTYDTAADVWAVGCSLYQTVMGEAPFLQNVQSRNFGGPVRNMVERLGPPPEILQDSFYRLYVENHSLRDLSLPFREALQEALRLKGASPTEAEQFCNLLLCMFAWEPARRITPEEALKHPFLNN